MSVLKYFAMAGDKPYKVASLGGGDALDPVTVIDGDYFEGCIFNEAGWIKGQFSDEKLVRHETDELLLFAGSDVDDYRNLNAEIEIQIENDTLRLTKCCIVFVPAGAAHGNISVKSIEKPVYYYACQLAADTYKEEPAEPSAAAGTFVNNVVETYAPVGVHRTTEPTPTGKPLIWIDGSKIKGAPYMESMWFTGLRDRGPDPHVHDFDEFLGFFGSDPDNPDDLYGEMMFTVEDQEITFTKSSLVYVPRGVRHSPMFIKEINRPILHFSGGNGGDYKKS